MLDAIWDTFPGPVQRSFSAWMAGRFRLVSGHLGALKSVPLHLNGALDVHCPHRGLTQDKGSRCTDPIDVSL